MYSLNTKKKVYSFLAIIICLLFLTPFKNVFAYDLNLNFTNVSGNLVISPEYDTISPFSSLCSGSGFRFSIGTTFEGEDVLDHHASATGTSGCPSPVRINAASGIFFGQPAGIYYITIYHLTIDDIWGYFQVSWDGTTVTPYTPTLSACDTDPTTHIFDFTPADGTTTSNPVTFSLHACVSPNDIGTFIGVKFTLHNIDQNVLLFTILSPSDIYFLDGFNATTSGEFDFSTTTTVGEGNYRINAVLERSYLSGFFENPFSPINQDLSHQFIVGSSTFIGNLSQNGFTELQTLLGSTTATTTDSANNCVPFSSNFSIPKCGGFLFIPDTYYLNVTLSQFKDGVLTHIPWGYATRFYSILSASTTVNLPTYTVPLMIGTNGNLSTTTLSFDPGDMLSGAGSLLTATRDPFNGKNIRDIFEPIVQLVVALGVLFTIVADLTGSHRHTPTVSSNPKQKKT